MSTSRTLFELGLIVVLAAAAPLIAQVLKLPSILLLLAMGFGAGAIGALDPNALLGEAVVSAVVSISVGVILFESGLNLKLARPAGRSGDPRRPPFGDARDRRHVGGRHRRVPSVVRSLLGGRVGARGGARRVGTHGGGAAARLHPPVEDGRQGAQMGGDAGRPDRRNARSRRLSGGPGRAGDGGQGDPRLSSSASASASAWASLGPRWRSPGRVGSDRIKVRRASGSASGLRSERASERSRGTSRAV